MSSRIKSRGQERRIVGAWDSISDAEYYRLVGEDEPERGFPWNVSKTGGIEGRGNLENWAIINPEAEIDRSKFSGSRLAVLVPPLSFDKLAKEFQHKFDNGDLTCDKIDNGRNIINEFQ